MDGNGETTISYIQIWNHPIETTISKWLFGVPGRSSKFLKDVAGHTFDGNNPATVEVGSLSHYLQDFLCPRWCRISSINSMYDKIQTGDVLALLCYKG